MTQYILNSTFCLVAFLVFYKLFLEKESFHHFKRFFLLSSVFMAFAIPTITFTTLIEVSPTPIENTFAITESTFPINNEYVAEQKIANYLPNVLWSIYLIGVSIFLTRFILLLTQLTKKIKRNTKIKYNDLTQVLLNEPTTPHTFLKYLFFNKKDFESDSIPQEVFWHEKSHAEQLHSIDIIIIEILNIVFWFNPLLYAYKSSIKLNHEFLADQAVLQRGVETKNYQNTLLNFSTNTEFYQLSNSINYSLFKKRFKSMKKHTSNTKKRFMKFSIIPLLLVLIYAFAEHKEEIVTKKQETEEIVRVVEDDPNFYVFYDKTGELVINSSPVEISNIESEIEKIISLSKSNNLKDLKVKVSLMKPMEEVLLNRISNTFRKNGVSTFGVGHFYKTSQQTIDEYKEFSKEFNSKPVNGVYKLKDVEKLKQLYNSLSDKEKLIHGPKAPQNILEIKTLLNQFNLEWEKQRNSNKNDNKRINELKNQLEEHYKNLTREQLILFDLGPIMPIPAPQKNQNHQKTDKSTSQTNQPNYFTGFNPSKLEKKSPTKTQFESWKNAEKFAIWIDEKHVPNSELDKYTTNDIVYFNGSFVHKNAKSERFPQDYQFSLYTKSGLENMISLDKKRRNKNKSFQFEFNLTSNHVELKDGKGGAWVDLGFPLTEGKKVYIDEMGMSDPDHENTGNNGELADYLISIELKGNKVIFTAHKGTNWGMVSFSTSLKSVHTLKYYINEQGLSVPKIQKDKEEIPLAIVEDAPIFPGCIGTTNNEFKSCFNKKVLEHLQSNFNTDLLKNSKFKSGNEYMNVKFVVDKNGKITAKSIGPNTQFTIKEDEKANPIEIFGNNKELQNEIIRVINSLPKMTPGEQEGEIVTVSFSFQIHFSLDANKIINLSPKLTP